MNILKIKFNSLDEIFSMAKSKEGLNGPDTIYYDSREHFLKSLTHQKIHVLSMIAQKNPKSISELANLAPEIQRERMSKICSELEAEGYITFYPSERGGKAPRLAFDYDAIYIQDSDAMAGNVIFIKLVQFEKLTEIKAKDIMIA